MKFKINKNVLIQEANEPQQGHIRRNVGKYATAGAIGAGAAAYNYSPEARNHINDIAQKGKDIVNQGIDNSQTLNGINQSIQHYANRAGIPGGDFKNIQDAAYNLINNPEQVKKDLAALSPTSSNTKPDVSTSDSVSKPEVQAPEKPSILNMIQKPKSGNDVANNVVNNTNSAPTNSVDKDVSSNPGADIDQTLRNIQNKNMSSSDQALINAANKTQSTPSPVSSDSPVAGNPGFDPASLPQVNAPVDDKASAISMLLKGQSQMPLSRQKEIAGEAYLQKQADEIMNRVPSDRQYFKQPSIGEEVDNISNKFGHIKQSLSDRLSDFTD